MLVTLYQSSDGPPKASQLAMHVTSRYFLLRINQMGKATYMEYSLWYIHTWITITTTSFVD